MSQPISRGALIILEGCDRAGKTTQAKMLVNALTKKGINAEFMRFPERSSSIGMMIDSYLTGKDSLDDHAIHLLFSANRWEHAFCIKESLKSGKTLVIDRYAFSGVAYSATKPGLSLEWCKQPDIGLPKPDQVIFLNLPIEEAKERGEFGNEVYEKEHLQTMVYDNYMKLKDPSWMMVDASRSEDLVHSDLMDCTFKIIEKVKSTPIEKLWS